MQVFLFRYLKEEKYLYSLMLEKWEICCEEVNTRLFYKRKKVQNKLDIVCILNI